MLESYISKAWQPLVPYTYHTGAWIIPDEMYVYTKNNWELVWQNIGGLTISRNTTDLVIDTLIKGHNEKRLHIVIAQGVTVSASSVLTAAIAINNIVGREIVIDNYGTIAGHLGRGTTSAGENGGTAIYARTNVIINNHGYVYGGGGGGGAGGRGGDGSYTTTTQRTAREPASGSAYQYKHTSYVSITSGNVQTIHQIWWGGSKVYEGTSSSPITAGGYTYYVERNSVQKQDSVQDNSPHGVTTTNWSKVYRTHTVTDIHTHNTVGGAGGKGGDGEGISSSARTGQAGQAGGQGAGAGGRGGHGGAWGTDGSRGETGANAKRGNGRFGEAGGKAGHAVDGIVHITYNEHGTTRGLKV